MEVVFGVRGGVPMAAEFPYYMTRTDKFGGCGEGKDVRAGACALREVAVVLSRY